MGIETADAKVHGTMELDAYLANGRVKQTGLLEIMVNPLGYEVDGKRNAYAGILGQAVTDDATNYVYLDHTGALQVNTTGWPDNTHVRLARVVTQNGSITTIMDDRVILTATLDKEINYESDEAADTTALTDWQEKVKLSVTDLPAGTYLVQWYCEMKHSNNTLSEYAEARVTIDDTTEIGQSIWPYGDYEDMAGFRVYTMGSAGDHEFDIDFRVQGGGSAYIRRARLFLWRIA
jgi:hypothetical protein